MALKPDASQTAEEMSPMGGVQPGLQQQAMAAANMAAMRRQEQNAANAGINAGLGNMAYQAPMNAGMSAGMKRGGKVKKMASGGKTSSASKRADGIAQRGKTKGRMI